MKRSITLITLMTSVFYAQASAATLTVINTNDAGVGSLRQAILDANGNSGLDIIQFHISGAGVHTITPATFLPFITSPLVPAGGGSGIVVPNGINNDVIQGNLIGTDASGTQPLGNGLDGVQILGSFNVIGGTDVMARNIISANGIHGIFLGTNNATVQNNLIQGNFIGTDIIGTQLLGNAADGVSVVESISNTVGGTVSVAGEPPGNVIAGNRGNGVGVSFGAFGVTGLTIEGNSIFRTEGLALI